MSRDIGEGMHIIDIREHEISEAVDECMTCALAGKWERVIDIYKSFSEAHTAVINDTVGTALHMAVDTGEEEVVKELVDAILVHEEGRILALEMVKERGDTPLHLAASKVSYAMCRYIIGYESERRHLMCLKNKEGETPLFLAALNWHKGRHAFGYLCYISRGYTTFDDLVRYNGDTILHCAIFGGYFDLAVIIMYYYDFLAIHTNSNGFTPLKALASMPSAFKSTSNLSGWKLLLYHCTLVEPLDPESITWWYLRETEKWRPKISLFPKNYAICGFFFRLLLSVIALPALIKVSKKENRRQKRRYQSTNGIFPPNYATTQQFVMTACELSTALFGLAYVKEVRKTKRKHQWSGQLLMALMQRPYGAYTGSGGQPIEWSVDLDMYNVYNQFKQGETSSWVERENAEYIGICDDAIKGNSDPSKNETAFVIAARNGIIEMVKEILRRIPSVIYETSSRKENVLMVAVTNRQPLVVEELRKRLMGSKPEIWYNFIGAVDHKANNMLHLAGQGLDEDKPWQIAGSALQMMWDVKWFQYIKRQVPQHYYLRRNKDGKTATDIFKSSHQRLIKDSSQWLKDTSESCSVVVGLVAGVSFATASTVPGGTDEAGKSQLEGQAAFNVFAISSLAGLCFSVMALVMFLCILTSRKEARDFLRGLPLMLLLGLSSLLVSITAMLVSFCSGHYFLVSGTYKGFLWPAYALTAFPVFFFAVVQLPLYYDLLTTVLTRVPHAANGSDDSL